MRKNPEEMQRGSGVWDQVRQWRSLSHAASLATPGTPAMARSDNRSAALYDRARELAAGSTDETAARDELIRLARGRRKTLQRAEKVARMSRAHLEREQANRVWRILHAALHDQPVRPATAAELAHLRALDRLLDPERSHDEIWEDLSTREPRLELLRRQVAAGRFGANDSGERSTAQRAEGLAAINRQAVALRKTLELRAALNPLIGPRSTHPDTLMVSERVYKAAYFYLLGQRPGRSRTPG